MRFLLNIISDRRYPPASPAEIVEVMYEADGFINECIVNDTVSLAFDLKRIVGQQLTKHTGIEYRIS